MRRLQLRSRLSHNLKCSVSFVHVGLTIAGAAPAVYCGNNRRPAAEMSCYLNKQRSDVVVGKDCPALGSPRWPPFLFVLFLLPSTLSALNTACFSGGQTEREGQQLLFEGRALQTRPEGLARLPGGGEATYPPTSDQVTSWKLMSQGIQRSRIRTSRKFGHMLLIFMTFYFVDQHSKHQKYE